MLAVPVGLLARAILVVNNVRDIDTDRRAGKRTLAVRLGRERTRVLLAAMVAAAFVTARGAVVRSARSPAWLLLTWPPRRSRWASCARAHAHRRALAQPGARAQRGAAALVFCLLLCAGHPARAAASELRALEVARRTLRLARPLRDRLRRRSRERELLEVTLRDERRTPSATARRRRSSPTTASADRERGAARAATPTRRVLPPGEPRRAIGGARRSMPAARVDALPQALAAIDMALWDLAGRRAGEPVCELLGATRRRGGRRQRQHRRRRAARGRRRAAAAAAAAGYSCVKLKVGVGDDAGRVAAVRAAAGPGCRAAARRQRRLERRARRRAMLEALAPSTGSSSSRSRCAGSRRPRALRERVPVRIAIDETAASPGALDGARRRRRLPEDLRAAAGSAACSRRRASCARPAPRSTCLDLDGPLGIAAALHAAAALAAAAAALRPRDARLFAGAATELLPVQRRRDRGAGRARASASR